MMALPMLLLRSPNGAPSQPERPAQVPILRTVATYARVYLLLARFCTPTAYRDTVLGGFVLTGIVTWTGYLSRSGTEAGERAL